MRGLGFFLLCGYAISLDYPSSAPLPPTAVTACLYLRFRKKLPVLRLCVLMTDTAGLCIGGALTLLAPGNAQRLLLTHDMCVLSWQGSDWAKDNSAGSGTCPARPLRNAAPPLAGAEHSRLAKTLREPVDTAFSRVGPALLLPAVLTHAAYQFTAWPPPRPLRPAPPNCSSARLLSPMLRSPTPPGPGTPLRLGDKTGFSSGHGERLHRGLNILVRARGSGRARGHPCRRAWRTSAWKLAPQDTSPGTRPTWPWSKKTASDSSTPTKGPLSGHHVP